MEKVENQQIEELSKTCPRCGKSSANSSNPSGRCRACLNKLASNKKKPGHWQRAQTKFDDAKRRENGKNGTAHHKSKGRVKSRKAFVSKVQNAEKKTGQKLSPDRVDNSRGYGDGNTRMVPEKLNRGRHHVDGKKLRAWQKRLKKTDLTDDQFYTMVLAKAQESADTALLSLLEDMHPNDLINFINNEDDGADVPQSLKKTELLTKEAAMKLPAQLQGPHNMPAIHSEIGKTHTVEIHPDIDHLYNVKNFAQKDPRGKVKVIDIKQNKGLKHMADKVPRDPQGWVTPEAIDKHIAGLPKQKINLRVLPFTMAAQQHRELSQEDGKKHQYVISAQLHPETLMSMKPGEKKAWEAVRATQHIFEQDDIINENTHQFGWGRVDPYKAETWETPGEGSGSRWSNSVPNHGHWHLDELQSDFQHDDKLADRVRDKKTSYKDHLKYGGEKEWVTNHWKEGRASDFDAWINDEKNKNHPAYNNFKKQYEENNKIDDTPENKKRYEQIEKMPWDSDERKQAQADFNAHWKKTYDEAQKHGITKSMEDFLDAQHKEVQEYNAEMDSHRQHLKGLHDKLSHGHDDPQHAIHSAVNAFGRKMGINSMSMDTPEDQAKQSGLRNSRELYNDHDTRPDRLENVEDEMYDHHPGLWEDEERTLKDNTHPSLRNPYFKSALSKIGGMDALKAIADGTAGVGNSVDLPRNIHGIEDNKKLEDAISSLTGPESDALHEMMIKHYNRVYDTTRGYIENDEGVLGYQEEMPEEEFDEKNVPLHQQDTYNKRPKKLGAERKNKADILGEDPTDKQKEVQYMKLHKKLKFILDSIRKSKTP